MESKKKGQNMKVKKPKVKVVKKTIKSSQIKEEVIQFGQNRYIFKEDKKSLAKLIGLPKGIYAILHNNDLLEVIFSPQDKTLPLLQRKFNFYYLQDKYLAYFGTPTAFFKDIFIERYQGMKREDDFQYDFFYTNLLKFKDFYSLNEKSDERIKKYFLNKIPVNFFIKGTFPDDFDFKNFADNLNFFTDFFDRKSPEVVTYNNEDVEKVEFKVPCHLDSGVFPSDIEVKQITPVLLDIFTVARNTPNPVLQYLFYFQVLEYVSFYYMKEETKKNLYKVIGDPNINFRVNNIIKIITEESREYINMDKDSIRLEHAITNLCDYKDIKREIQTNLNYFLKPVVFDGGYTIGPLLNNTQDIDNPSPQIMASVKNNIEKIRNVLVHLRESRESKVILPTKRNHKLLRPYLYLIKRIAEQLAIHFE